MAQGGKDDKEDVAPKKHDDDTEDDKKNSGGGGKKKTKDDKEDKEKTKDDKEDKESDVYDTLPKGDLSKEAKALREMIIQLLKLIEEVDEKQKIMKGKDANLNKTKEELEAKVEELQKKLKAIND